MPPTCKLQMTVLQPMYYPRKEHVPIDSSSFGGIMAVWLGVMGLLTLATFVKCNLAIHTAATTSGAAGAIPIPAADALPISAAQIAMVLALGKVFEQEITDSAAKGLIGAAASTFAGRNLIKLIPFAGWIASAAVAAGVTEAIGWTIAVDFAKNARREWDRKRNAEETAQAYATAE